MRDVASDIRGFVIVLLILALPAITTHILMTRLAPGW